MKITGNTILITGGATGIGFSLAEAMVKAGNEVIICGRRESRLKDAKEKLSLIHTMVCDVTDEKQREALFDWTTTHFKSLNMLINNAGIQRRINLNNGFKDLLNGDDEITTNLTAPIYLATRFIPFLAEKKEAAIINVSSGLGFMPSAAMPVYCATKAALHSFTISLRYQLRDSSIKVFEIVPPSVNTELGIPMNEKGVRYHGGIPPAEVAATTLGALTKNEYEIFVGGANNIAMIARTNPEKAFKQMNSW